MASCTPIKRESPKLFLENEYFEIGQVHQGDSSNLAFQLYNKGGDTLRILSVGTSCGCTDAILGDSLLFSGDSTILSLTFHAQDTGVFKKHIVIETNADSTYKTIELLGKVIPRPVK